jgi:hypothetical protein
LKGRGRTAHFSSSERAAGEPHFFLGLLSNLALKPAISTAGRAIDGIVAAHDATDVGLKSKPQGFDVGVDLAWYKKNDARSVGMGDATEAQFCSDQAPTMSWVEMMPSLKPKRLLSTP